MSCLAEEMDVQEYSYCFITVIPLSNAKVIVMHGLFFRDLWSPVNGLHIQLNNLSSRVIYSAVCPAPVLPMGCWSVGWLLLSCLATFFIALSLSANVAVVCACASLSWCWCCWLLHVLSLAVHMATSNVARRWPDDPDRCWSTGQSCQLDVVNVSVVFWTLKDSRVLRPAEREKKCRKAFR
jgi:hypothetical protein